METRDDLEDELEKIIKGEIMKELAIENGLTVGDMQSKIDESAIEGIHEYIAYKETLSDPVDGVYNIKFTQLIPNFVGGVDPAIIECNTVDELIRHPLFIKTYQCMFEGFQRYELTDDVLFAIYDNERMCCGTITTIC